MLDTSNAVTARTPHRGALAKRLVVIVVLGVVLGALSKMADDTDPVLLSLASNAGLWTFFAAVAGRYASSFIKAAVQSVLLMCTAVIAYYVTYWLIDGNVEPAPVVVVWLVSSILVGSALGVLGYLTGRPQLWTALGNAVLAGFFASEAETLEFSQGSNNWLTIVFDVCAAVLFLIADPRSWRRQTLALLLTPLFVVLGTAIPWLYRHLFAIIAP